MIQNLPYDTLFQVYRDSIEYSLEKEFIELLEQELQRREEHHFMPGTLSFMGETDDSGSL
jgi:hypothetical protein